MVISTVDTTENLLNDNFSSKNQTPIEKQKRVINKNANSIIITKKRTGLISKNTNTKKKTGLISKNTNSEHKQLIYVSPSTSKTCHVLQNVKFSPSCSSQLLHKNKSSSIPCSPSLDFPHLGQDSRAGSLSDISHSNLLD